jgi:zinc/manganese transport system substrate-binding protein
MKRKIFAALVAICALGASGTAWAQDKMPVIATFSILGDLVKNVGGDRVEVATLVGADSDAHVYAPTPADVKKIAAAKVVFINGLGFEGWTTRLVKASGTKAPTVTIAKGIKSRKMEEEGHGHGGRSPTQKSMSPISGMVLSPPIQRARARMKPMPAPISPSLTRWKPK